MIRYAAIRNLNHVNQLGPCRDYREEREWMEISPVIELLSQFQNDASVSHGMIAESDGGFPVVASLW